MIYTLIFVIKFKCQGHWGENKVIWGTIGDFLFSFAILQVKYFKLTYRIDVSLIETEIYTYIYASSCIDQGFTCQNKVRWGNIEEICFLLFWPTCRWNISTKLIGLIYLGWREWSTYMSLQWRSMVKVIKFKIESNWTMTWCMAYWLDKTTALLCIIYTINQKSHIHVWTS